MALPGPRVGCHFVPPPVPSGQRVALGVRASCREGTGSWGGIPADSGGTLVWGAGAGAAASLGVFKDLAVDGGQL